MQIITGNKQIDAETDAREFYKLFEKTNTPMSCTFDDIKNYRETVPGLRKGRLMAIIPVEIWLFIQHWAPEILKSKPLFKLWLNKHREYQVREVL